MFHALGAWNANARWPHDLVLVATILRMLGYEDEISILADVYTVKSSDMYILDVK